MDMDMDIMEIVDMMEEAIEKASACTSNRKGYD